MSTIGRIIDRTGEVHNGITFVKTTGSRAEDGAVVWELRCHCGAIFNRSAEKIIKGNTKSCGCTRYDKVKRAGEEATTRIHGESYSRLYGIWAMMLQRCNNPNHTSYHNYGGRGIEVCEEWGEYLPFRDWALKNGYSDELTIDRIEVNGNYESNNCRWVSHTIQNRNQRLSTKNTSGIRGVTFCKKSKKWIARIKVNKKSIGLGYYTLKKDAALARKQGEKVYWGEEYQDFDGILADLELNKGDGNNTN